MSGQPTATATDTESSLGRFRYQPEKIQIGVVHHYVKSNLDGSKPVRVSLRVASETHIEVLKVYPRLPILFLVTADMDWSMFSAARMHSYQVMPNGKVVEQLSNTLSATTREYQWFRGADGFPKVVVDCLPCHEYNFDFASLNYSFRHLIDPESTFEIGVTRPDMTVLTGASLSSIDKSRRISLYSGRAMIEYEGDERVDGGDCRRYRIGGAGMEGLDGRLWVNKQHECFQVFEHPTADNPGWNSFRLALSSTEPMTDGQWSAFIDRARRAQRRYQPMMLALSLAGRLRRN